VNTRVSRVLVAAAVGTVLTLTGACNHKGDDVDTNPGGGNDAPGEDEGGGY
jgi:ABC-type enterobactin transport system permease subunit